MAVSLAVLTGLLWIALALAGLTWRRRSGQDTWDIWDALRGVGVLAHLRDVPGWLASAQLLGDGRRLGVEAGRRGDALGAARLARAEVASALSMLVALRRSVRECRRRARVLQFGGHLPPLPARDLSLTGLRALAMFDSCAALPLGSAGRLRLRLGVLDVALGMLWRRANRLARSTDERLLPRLSRLASDIAILMDATSAGRHALSQGWVATRAERRALAASADPRHVS